MIKNKYINFNVLYKKYKTLINLIESYNGLFIFVGGCVRDIIMNKPVKDVDAEIFFYAKIN